jgi:uncharacterized integral membrane protein
MSDSRTTPPADEGARPDSPPTTSSATEPSGSTPATTATTATGKSPDPLRGSATSGIWLAVVAFAVLLVLLAIFILQNTGSVELSFLGWSGSAPLAALLLIAAAAGALLVVMAGSLRILQLRRRVRSERKRAR